MYLTPDNAPNLLGKTLDATKHILGVYPYKVIQFPDGTYGAMDRAEVCTPVSNDQFNQVWFDMVDGKPVPYYEGSSAKIVLEDGTVVSGDLDGPEEAFRGFGYVSHFATCPKAGKFRRKP